MAGELQRRKDTDRWIAVVRLGAVVFAVVQVGLTSGDYPPGYAAWAWGTTAVLAAGALILFWLSRIEFDARAQRRVCLLALTFDAAICSAYVFIYSYEPGTPIRQLLLLPVVEAALRYGIRGGVAMPIAFLPALVAFEWSRAERFGPPGFTVDHVTFPFGVQLLMGLIVGWLVRRLQRETAFAEGRAAEAERLRDELGRRADLLDAANRCARALSSSLDPERAFSAFIRELQGLIEFERVALVLADDGTAQVIAAAGAGADSVFPRGTRRPLAGSVLEEIIRTGQAVYRRDMTEQRHPEEEEFAALGLRCRLAAPLLAGSRVIGMLSVLRREPSSFTAEEIDLAQLLGRLVGTAVQNIRAYEAERRTADELRRLSALRADFVSLVSHELRTPMAAVVGAARTLQQRWRELNPEQRASFLALIGDETSRLADLISDVLDTSRIEAGAFTYRFSDVDVAQLVREAVATAELAQDEVRLRAEVSGALRVRGDRERLRQVLDNLLENAVKYSPAGDEVEIAAYAANGTIRIDVRDSGPGIRPEDQRIIFEKFGRVVAAGSSKPGTGLGLFIARSIAEAHGGSLEVRSEPEQGATFTLALPAEMN